MRKNAKKWPKNGHFLTPFWTPKNHFFDQKNCHQAPYFPMIIYLSPVKKPLIRRHRAQKPLSGRVFGPPEALLGLRTGSGPPGRPVWASWAARAARAGLPGRPGWALGPAGPPGPAARAGLAGPAGPAGRPVPPPCPRTAPWPSGQPPTPEKGVEQGTTYI